MLWKLHKLKSNKSKVRIKLLHKSKVRISMSFYFYFELMRRKEYLKSKSSKNCRCSILKKFHMFLKSPQFFVVFFSWIFGVVHLRRGYEMTFRDIHSPARNNVVIFFYYILGSYFIVKKGLTRFARPEWYCKNTIFDSFNVIILNLARHYLIVACEIHNMNLNRNISLVTLACNDELICIFLWF